VQVCKHPDQQGHLVVVERIQRVGEFARRVRHVLEYDDETAGDRIEH